MMITEIKVGDYIEKSELDTKQKYNDVVAVFEQWGFSRNNGHALSYCEFVEHENEGCLIAHDGLLMGCRPDDVDLKRKLTYIDIMSLKKVDLSNVSEAHAKLKEIISKAKVEAKKDGKKYHREIIGFCGTKVEIDVYRVLDAYNTESASIDHAIKKLLCTGLRGHKDFITDIDNAIESLEEAKMLYLQKQEIDNA
ncbi:hypothetical protein [Pseudoalteromonas sp.]|uniref:hypothetical protein n=1 Tax=Pseudoalteromonas sp. TaxID=53249 RepID=UPI003D0BA4D2